MLALVDGSYYLLILRQESGRGFTHVAVISTISCHVSNLCENTEEIALEREALVHGCSGTDRAEVQMCHWTTLLHHPRQREVTNDGQSGCPKRVTSLRGVSCLKAQARLVGRRVESLADQAV